MRVTLKFKNDIGQCFKYVVTMTVKQAIKLFNERLKNDSKIIKVWLTRFDDWHEYHYKTLKDMEK